MPPTDPTATAATWECGRCGDKFTDHEAAQAHADHCDRPTIRVVTGIHKDTSTGGGRD